MNLSKFAVAAGIAGVALCGVANATLLDLNGYTGPIEFKFNNAESFSSTTLAPGVQNFGVVQVTSIVNPNTGANVWTQGQGGQFLSAVFNGLTVTSVTPSGSSFVTTNSGGTFQLWLDNATFDPGQGTSGYAAGGCAVGGLCYNGITNTGGTDLLNFNLVPGTTTDPTNTLNATTNTLTVPVAGVAEGFADITGGADASEFGRGGEGPTMLGTFADIHLRDNFCVPGQAGCAGPTSSNWENFSFDPVDAVAVTPVVPIPEPASLSILAGALLGLGMWGRRRR